ncbi:hypothetical protein [Mucilaginibacter phyllosphaerae]|uniref:Type VI secretion system baseplate subunit TssK n=1 Tax=Mucilaginibacter phyllosphaerae TaxID=1812349 RepID=A0A4Y8AIK5_9SPHI|nr:hypothetical protein [Mucilaginibacter phyllosphaerae]MBB3968074.1 hypothetical protein [Mucilaginibacter phyllosphaerae]TEW68903.1 hypothetical protein E2R65_01705 [Mucilaginibacter phyllosphaerae]GGH01407.1 hypothetical protein GCM10007352_03150 [Mucilaginibacter phyllosphaerae]
MYIPLKYRSVNWVDGMKISSGHFVQTDNFIQDVIRDSNSIMLNSNNFGLLAPFNGEKSSLDIQITERASNHIQVKIRQCNAITSEGYRIRISPEMLGQELEFNHYFSQEPLTDAVETFFIILTVNPHERIAVGRPDADETPARYPEVDSFYGITILPAAQISAKNNHYLEVGKLNRSSAGIQLITDYIPPCAAILSHPDLIRFYETFSNNLNEFQLLSFRIIDKITSKDTISPIGRNVKLLCDKMLDYIARIYFSYRNVAFQQQPLVLVGYFSEMAHIFFSTVKSIAGAEREELLKYFYEWKDVTPGNFEELLARLIEVVYNHHDIRSAMVTVDEFLRVIIALWNKLSTLEYIGQRKENIVVAEQQIVQTVQAKRTWTLLD